VRHPLDPLFNPTSVAVVGASTVLHKTGGRRWRSMVESGFDGPLYPIHPTASEVLGCRAYPSLRDVPGPVEMAVVLVRPDLVPGAIADCAAIGVRGIVVISAGFGETGEDGRRVERELVAVARASGARLVGPNCAGLFSGSGRVNAMGWDVPRGPIALISQSGNMALTFGQLAREKGQGFSKLVTVGNAADVRIPEYLDYLFADPDTSVIVAYLEGFGPLQGRALWELMRSHPSPKPVIVLKPGDTESGRRAALSHTGALAGEGRIVDAAFRQCGIIRAAESEDAWDAAIALASLPPLASRNVAVISDGGGHATIVCDTADRCGLAVPTLSAPTQGRLSEILPARSGIANPIDFAGQAEEEPEVVPRVADVCLSDPAIGAAIFAGHFGGYVKIATPELGLREQAAARELAEVVRRHGKPFILHTIYARERLPALEILRAAGVPLYGSLEASAKAMAACWRAAATPRARVAARRSRPDRARVDAILSRASSGSLLEPDARELLAAYGIAVPPSRVTATAESAMEAAHALGGLLAMKLVAPELLHKSDAGGVLLDVTPERAAEGYRALAARAAGHGIATARVLVTPMICGGLECVVGAFRDPQFGPVVMFGLGGVDVEAVADVAFRVAPIDGDEARAMTGEIRAHRVLGAARGRPARDVDAAVDVMVRVSELMADLDAIAELDVNPLFLLDRGAVPADARAIVR
jgi:acetate---CoA ligase (ADP-forming)